MSFSIENQNYWVFDDDHPLFEDLYCRNGFTDHGMRGELILLFHSVLCQICSISIIDI